MTTWHTDNLIKTFSNPELRHKQQHKIEMPCVCVCSNNTSSTAVSFDQDMDNCTILIPTSNRAKQRVLGVELHTANDVKTCLDPMRLSRGMFLFQLSGILRTDSQHASQLRMRTPLSICVLDSGLMAVAVTLFFCYPTPVTRAK